uniref:MD-2-related lipid-recognition domain-containing protein n=1 Tax=Anopheles arabiensis TaxID=7173 RepID=A0A2C9GRL6_ANOAR
MKAIIVLFILAFHASCLRALDMRLIPVIDHKEVQSDQRFLNATVEDVGDRQWNRTYLAHFGAMRAIKEFKVLLSYSVRAFDGAVQKVLLSRLVDGCEVYRKPPTDRLIKSYYDPVMKNSKVSSCPYKAGQTMMLNVTPSMLPVPSFIPESGFLIEIKGYIKAGADIIYETRWYGRLVRMFNVNKNI